MEAKDFEHGLLWMDLQHANLIEWFHKLDESCEKGSCEIEILKISKFIEGYISEHFSMEEKLAVMEDVWRIILLDGQLEKHEDHYAHKLANLLRLSHKQMIGSKLKAREQIAGV